MSSIDNKKAPDENESYLVGFVKGDAVEEPKFYQVRAKNQWLASNTIEELILETEIDRIIDDTDRVYEIIMEWVQENILNEAQILGFIKTSEGLYQLADAYGMDAQDVAEALDVQFLLLMCPCCLEPLSALERNHNGVWYCKDCDIELKGDK